MITVGDRLREERKRLGLSQDDLAGQGGVSRRTQINYESGERSPDAEYLHRVHAAGVDVCYVVVGTREPTAAQASPVSGPVDALAERIATLTRAQRAALSALIEAFS
jgi:transcriptional regulator with XRE-family HTH domain